MGQKKRVNRHPGSEINGKTDSRLPNGAGAPDGVEKLGDGTGQRKFDTLPLGSICNVEEAAGHAEVTTQAKEIEGVKDSLQVLQLSEGVMNEKQSKIRNAAKGDKKDGSGNVKAECEKALLALKRGNSTKALKLIRDACTRNENSVLAHRVHAQICSRLAAMIEDPTTKQRHFKSALASVKKGLEKSPNSLECILCHAQLLLETSNESTGYEEAIRESERGLFIADPVDPGKDYIYDESQQEFSTSKARIEHVQNELRNLKQKANYASLTTWMKSFDNPTIFPIKNDGFEILQPKRPTERKKIKTAEERRQEIEVRVAAARLLQQKAEAPCDEPTEEEKGANMPPTRRKKNVSNNRRTSKTADMEGHVEKMRSFWHSASAEERATLLEAPLFSFQEHIGTSTSRSCVETLNEALDFARKNNTWRFWACCKCGVKFVEHQEHINHVVREHVGALGHELEEILPQEVEQVWIDQLMNDDCRPINEASAIELLKSMFDASLEVESVEEGWASGVKEESTLSTKCNGNSMPSPKLLVIADPDLCFQDLPISDDMNRRRLLDRIYSLYRKLLGKKCLANAHVERIIQFSIEETQKMLSDSAVQFPPSLIYVRLLPVEQLQTIHRHLLDLAHACGLDRHESQVNNGEIMEEIIQDRLYFSDDHSLLHVDEGVIKEACVKIDGDGYARYMNSDKVPALSSEEMKDFLNADQQLSWIYGKAEYEENICEWKAFQENRAHEGRDVFRNVEREYRQVHHLCERKHRCLNYDEALTFAENLCLTETKMKEDGSYQSYEEVLKDRLKEMQDDLFRKQHSNASRVEFEVISSVLKDAEAVHVPGFSNEDMRSISSAKRLYDFENDSEVQESFPCSNTCIEISLQRQKESIFAEVSQLDAKLIRSIEELHIWQQKLNGISLFDYTTIVLPSLKSFLKYRLESAAEKDALQRSDAAREAFLAELANEKNGTYKDFEVSKLPREKLKDKKKVKEQKKALPNNYVSGINGCHGTGSISSDEIEDEHDIGLDLTDKGILEAKMQQELDLRRREELEAEERKLNEALELQRKVEEEAKEKILVQQQKKLADEAARLAVVVEDSLLSSNTSFPVLTHQNGHIYLENRNVGSSPIPILTPTKTVGEEFHSTASSNAATSLRLRGSSLSLNSGPSAVTSPSTEIASVQALPLGPSDSNLPLSKLKPENMTLHLNPKPKHVTFMQCPKEGHTDEIVKNNKSGSMQIPDGMFRPSRFMYPGSDKVFLNTTVKSDMSSSAIVSESAINNVSKKHNPEIPSGYTAGRTPEAADYNPGVGTFLRRSFYSSAPSQHVVPAHNTVSRLNEATKVEELEPQIAIKDSIPGAALNKASDVQQICVKKNKDSASRIRRTRFVRPPQGAAHLPEEVDKEISECFQAEVHNVEQSIVQYRTHATSSNDKKRLRELKVEQDEEERFQSDLKQAMQQSLGKTSDLPEGTTPIRVDNNTGHDFPSIKDIQEGVVKEIGKGLQNEVGQYNCFLNVVIQSLWRLRSFREEILSSSSINHAHVGTPCIVCALRDIFRGMSSGLEVSRAEPVAPTALRVALSAMFAESRIFQEAQMNDASEVLSVIFDCIHKAFSTNPVDIDSDGSITGGDWDCQDGKPCIVHSLFGFDIAEQMNCRSCGLESRHLKYTTFFHNINASALRTAKIMYQDSSLDELLKLVDMNHLLACDIDVGGCGQQNYIHHLLRATPHVFTTVLGWQNSQENVDDISATVDAIDTVVDIGVVYRGIDEGFKHHLVSVVCYYGQHYHCFAYSYEHSKWVMFDDTTVKVIGGWHDVADTCRRGHLQPQVLFYEAALK